MNSEQNQQKNLIDTTDCLEAVGVFRGWKNFLFIVIACFLVLLQASFWLINTGYVKAKEGKAKPPAACEKSQQTEEAAKPTGQMEEIQQAAKKTTAEPKQPAMAETKLKQILTLSNIKIQHLTRFIRIADWALILTTILYCLTLLFALKISMLGRLGGINHIARAFFLSLIFAVLLLPWQKFFGNIIVGVLYTPAELLDACDAVGTKGIVSTVLYYLRFTSYGLIALLVLIAAQFRSSRWTKAILRRLEVI